MESLLAALALLSGIIGAGFASGREIVRFFAIHGRMAFAGAACALFTLAFLFLRLCTQLENTGCRTLSELCIIRFGLRLGRLCSALFFVLCAVTAGAMLCACGEIGSLILPIRHAYGLTLMLSLVLSMLFVRHGLNGLSIPGMLLCALLPLLFVLLLMPGKGEACFLPAMTPDLPVRAFSDAAAYGALNAAMLAGMLPALLALDAGSRKKAVALFLLLFGSILLLGIGVCRKHMTEIFMQPMPFVFLSRKLGEMGYLLLGACLYISAFSTLCAMLCGMQKLLGHAAGMLIPIAACILFACVGFGPLVSGGYPVLGALCAGLLFVLCLPGCPKKT